MNWGTFSAIAGLVVTAAGGIFAAIRAANASESSAYTRATKIYKDLQDELEGKLDRERADYERRINALLLQHEQTTAQLAERIKNLEETRMRDHREIRELRQELAEQRDETRRQQEINSRRREYILQLLEVLRVNRIVPPAPPDLAAL